MESPFFASSTRYCRDDFVGAELMVTVLEMRIDPLQVTFLDFTGVSPLESAGQVPIGRL